MEAARETPQEQPEASAPPAATASSNGRAIRIEPDLEFIRSLNRHGAATLKNCFQCGTCSATCDLSPDSAPFPRKEIAWSVWGMKDRLLADPDVWLCHQCHDCSTRCPRGVRPGDVLAAVRAECVQHYSAPRFFARWVNEPHCIPLLLGIPAALLTLALLAKEPVERALGITRHAGERIVFSYSSLFPHWLLNAFFGFFSLVALVVVVVGVARFWRTLRASVPPDRIAAHGKGVTSSILSTLRSVFAHDKFALCTTARPRLASHLCVFFGFLALTVVTGWVITARYNPLIRGEFVYPFGFWNPWKMLANLGGGALIAGCLLMAWERIKENTHVGAGSYFDWALIAKLVLVTLTGFVTEVLHYLRLEPHRHIAYFVHLVFVFVVLIYLPYSKLAHLAYRATALVFAEHSGREVRATRLPADAGQDPGRKGRNHVGETTARS